MLATCCLHRLQLPCYHGSIVHFFACCVLRLDTLWHSSRRETQSGTHWLTHRLPANITSCLPPLRPRLILPTFKTSSRQRSAFTQLFSDHHSDRRYVTKSKLDVAFARLDRLCQPRDSRTQQGGSRGSGNRGRPGVEYRRGEAAGPTDLMTRTLTLTTSSARRSSLMQLS